MKFSQFSGLPLSVIIDYIQNVPAQEWLDGDAFDDFGVCHRQLRSLWTAYCITNDYNVDTLQYDVSLSAVWVTIDKIADIGKSQHTFADYDKFDDYMCADLV